MNNYTFLLKAISTIDTVVVGNTCIVTCHITSVIEDFPYEGKFEQIDYGVKLEFSSSLTAQQINNELPIVAQQWINTQYPNT